jgi:hypothetical protein
MDVFEQLIEQAEQDGWRGRSYDEISYGLQMGYNLLSWREHQSSKKQWTDVEPQCREAHARALKEREGILSREIPLALVEEHEEALDPCSYCGEVRVMRVSRWRVGEREIESREEKPCDCLRVLWENPDPDWDFLFQVTTKPPLPHPLRGLYDQVRS